MLYNLSLNWGCLTPCSCIKKCAYILILKLIINFKILMLYSTKPTNNKEINNILYCVFRIIS